ncbi:hypothetical protein A3F66_02255 [candidate division TM6 bacterium RIFCSPHIGHO2_12_FULL_32_22]|nr:MAG: hypothetical protein A3F66_02255 [candidate division TM6 bacterium RIFCSPHIGHO2_12_FULL_32_22]
MKIRLTIFVILAVLLLAIGCYSCKDIGLNIIRDQGLYATTFVNSNYACSIFLYILGYIICVVSTLPLSAIMTVLGGFLFGVSQGIVFSVIGAAVGASLSFIFFRHVLGRQFQKHYAARLSKFNAGVERHGSLFLIMSHFLFLPFFIINALASMTRISYWTFLWTTVVGIIPGTLLYSYAGYQLRIANSTGEIFSWKIILIFSLILVVLFGSIILQNYKSNKKF